MLAEENKTYAQILNGKVHWIFNINDLPEWNEENILVVDITNENVDIGDLYDGIIFSKPISVKKVAPISPRQIRMVLLSLGITEAQIDEKILELPSPDKEQAMIAWKYSLSYERDFPMVALLGAALGLTNEDIDMIWLSASGI